MIPILSQLIYLVKLTNVFNSYFLPHFHCLHIDTLTRRRDILIVIPTLLAEHYLFNISTLQLNIIIFNCIVLPQTLIIHDTVYLQYQEGLCILFTYTVCVYGNVLSICILRNETIYFVLTNNLSLFLCRNN